MNQLLFTQLKDHKQNYFTEKFVHIYLTRKIDKYGLSAGYWKTVCMGVKNTSWNNNVSGTTWGK